MLQPERMSFALGRSVRFDTYGKDGAGLPSTVNTARQPQRRLADSIDEVFRLALSRGDIATAEELLGAMEALYERDRIKFGEDRRGGSALLDKARQELAAKRASRYGRSY